MGKQTENSENLKKYQARLKELEQEGALTPSPILSDDELIRHLAAEGNQLLDMDAKASKKNITQDKPKLEAVLGLTSKNPYIRARTAILLKYPADKRNSIKDMEQTGNINNSRYDAFVKEVVILGDQLSDKS